MVSYLLDLSIILGDFGDVEKTRSSRRLKSLVDTSSLAVPMFKYLEYCSFWRLYRSRASYKCEVMGGRQLDRNSRCLQMFPTMLVLQGNIANYPNLAYIIVLVLTRRHYLGTNRRLEDPKSI